MTRWRWWTAAAPGDWPARPAQLDPRERDKAWPLHVQRLVRLQDPAEPGLFVDVEIAMLDEGPVVTGVAVRSAVPLDTHADGLAWREGGTFNAVEPSRIRALPLSTYIDAAIAIATDPKVMSGEDALTRASVPRSRPGDGTVFYREIAAYFRRLADDGEERPVAVIADRMSEVLGEKVPENRAHQWVWRAREYGFLERAESRGKVPAKKRRTSKPTRKGDRS